MMPPVNVERQCHRCKHFLDDIHFKPNKHTGKVYKYCRLCLAKRKIYLIRGSL